MKKKTMFSSRFAEAVPGGFSHEDIVGSQYLMGYEDLQRSEAYEQLWPQKKRGGLGAW